jgi:hypothetical protein
LSHSTSDLEWLIAIMLSLFVIAFAIAAVCLDVNTNSDSISGMVAQRWGRTSYFSILLTVAFTFFLSCLVLVNGILAEVRGFPMTFIITLGLTVSPLFSFAILIIPLPVAKTKEQLDMVPLGVVPSVPGNLYSLQMYHCRGCTSRLQKIGHYTSVGIGITIGWITSGYEVYASIRDAGCWYSLPTITAWYLHYGWVVGFLSMSVLCALLFIIWNLFDCWGSRPTRHNRGSLGLEFFALYYYMMSIVALTLIHGGIINVVAH